MLPFVPPLIGQTLLGSATLSWPCCQAVATNTHSTILGFFSPRCYRENFQVMPTNVLTFLRKKNFSGSKFRCSGIKFMASAKKLVFSAKHNFGFLCQNSLFGLNLIPWRIQVGRLSKIFPSLAGIILICLGPSRALVALSFRKWHNLVLIVKQDSIKYRLDELLQLAFIREP